MILEFPAEAADERAAIPPYLGTLCKRGHDHEGTGRSLRDAVTKDCRACDALRPRKGYTRRRMVHAWEQPTYDPGRYYLGKLCPRGHDYQGTGQSLRQARAGRGGCAACGSLRTMAYRNRQRAKVRAAYDGAAAEGVSP